LCEKNCCGREPHQEKRKSAERGERLGGRSVYNGKQAYGFATCSQKASPGKGKPRKADGKEDGFVIDDKETNNRWGSRNAKKREDRFACKGKCFERRERGWGPKGALEKEE